MSLTIYPKIGQIIMCDFSVGFKPPEIVKERPVIIIGTRPGGLVTVVALSTVKPDPVETCNLLLPKACMPQLGFFQEKESWLKGDMIYSVGFHRLDLIKLGKRGPDGKRLYFKNRLSRERMKEVYTCVLHGLKIGHIAGYL